MLTAILVGGIGCRTAVGLDPEKDADDAETDGDRSKAGPGRPGSIPSEPAPPPLPGCSAQPSCSDRSSNGELCRPTCDAACRKTHSHYSFWVNAFEVAGTGGLGRHQGISVLGVELAFDDRAAAGDTSPHAWPDPIVPRLPPDIGQTMTDDGRFLPFAMCSAPTVVLDLPLFNHGRTMSRDPAHAANRTELQSVHADGDAEAADDPSVQGTQAWRTRTKGCLGAIEDGHCDAVCGNCSYVLPAAAIDPTRHGDWSQASSLVGGTEQCSTGGYYGGPGMQSRERVFGSPYRNPFTHCARLACGADDEAPTINDLWGSDSAFVTGRFGHNSNADAEAEFRAFSACVSPGELDAAGVCAACGTVRERKRQDPCADRTNTAAAWWDRTANLTRDFFPAIMGDEGQRAPAPPRCAWGDFPVSGM